MRTYFIDNNTFGRKLCYLIDRHYKNMENKRARETPKSRFKREFCETYNNAKSSTVRDWILGKCTPSLDRLCDLANYFECDLDYFFSDQEEPNKEIATASEITELDYDTIKQIINLSPEIKKMIDYMANKEALKTFLMFCYNYITADKSYTYKKTLLNEVNKPITTAIYSGEVSIISEPIKDFEIHTNDNITYRLSIDGLLKEYLKTKIIKVLDDIESAKKTENTDQNNKPWDFADE